MNKHIRDIAKREIATSGRTRVEVAGELGMKPQYLNRMLNEAVGDVPKSWEKLFKHLNLELCLCPKTQPNTAPEMDE